jgi:hypothetical protein
MQSKMARLHRIILIKYVYCFMLNVHLKETHPPKKSTLSDRKSNPINKFLF